MTADASTPHVVLVGHCSYDSSGLIGAAERALPDVPTVRVNRPDELERFRSPGHLLLVNRVLDGLFDDESGVDLIDELTTGDGAPAVLLVSDLPDAQAKAEANGARPGFGKRDMHGEKAVDAIRAAWPG